MAGRDGAGVGVVGEDTVGGPGLENVKLFIKLKVSLKYRKVK